MKEFNQAAFDKLSTDFDGLFAQSKELAKLLDLAITDSKAFINQCDREGIGMQTVTDHRKRVEKFLSTVAKMEVHL